MSMILTYINIINSNMVIFDNTSLNEIFTYIYPVMLDWLNWTDLCKISGYQLQFFNNNLPENGKVLIVTCEVSGYELETSGLVYLDSAEFIYRSLSETEKWTRYGDVIRETLGSENLTVHLKFF